MAAVEAAVGLGSNLGDRERHLRGAVAGLAGLGGVVAVSSLYETAPVGGVPQPPYLNAVAVVATALAPRAVLEGLLRLEAVAGRERRIRWGPRTLDCDLLLHGGATIDQPGLRVPHPRLAERRFVLEPLLEVRPAAALPDGTPLRPLLDGVAGQEVRVHAAAGWHHPV